MLILILLYLILFFILFPFPRQIRFVRNIDTFTPDDIFYSFLPDPINGKYMGFYRTDAWNHASNLQQVYMDSNFNITKTELKTHGQDPRLFQHNKKTYVIDNYLDNVHIIDVDNENRIKIDLPGKNFIFFSYKDKLYIIHKILPLELYEFDVNSKTSTKIYSGSETENGEYRGGTMGYVKGDIIYGYGHRTYGSDDTLSHDIFYWELDMKNLAISVNDIEKPAGSRKISDPTCVINLHGNMYIITAETDRVWNKTSAEMEYLNKIYKLE